LLKIAFVVLILLAIAYFGINQHQGLR
jgi:hypothetical protein